MDSKFSRFLLSAIIIFNTSVRSQIYDSQNNDILKQSNVDCGGNAVESNKVIIKPDSQKLPSYNPHIVKPYSNKAENKIAESELISPYIANEVKIAEKPLSPPINNIVTDRHPIGGSDNSVICIEKSKIVRLGGGHFLYSGRRMIAETDSELVEGTSPLETRKSTSNSNSYPLATSYEEAANDIEETDDVLRQSNGNSLKCYACSNVSNPHCNVPNSLTTLKYCRTQSACLSKVILAEGMPILIRDCGDNCDRKYTYEECSVCHTELCNGAFSVTGSSFILSTISSLTIMFTIKYL